MSDAGPAAAPALRLGPLQLVAIKGTSAGQRFETAVAARPITIGRKPTNDLVLKDDTVSREHAVVEPTAEGWRLVARKREALLMRAGEVVPEEGALLADGDELTLGRAVVKVTIARVAADEDADRTIVFAPVAPPPRLEPPRAAAPARVATPLVATGLEAAGVRPAAEVYEEAPEVAERRAREEAREEAGQNRAHEEEARRRAAEADALERSVAEAERLREAEQQARRMRATPVRERFAAFDVVATVHESETLRVDRALQAGAPVTLRRVRAPHLGFLARRRYLRASDGLRGITHPNLLAPRESGRAAGDLFQVYPPVRGAAADVVLREGRRDVPIDLAVWIAREVAYGLAHLEQVRGRATCVALADGDVVCSRDGAVVLLLAPPLPASASGDRYEAPEVHAGGGADLRAATFSLGVLLWELLACEPVLAGQQTTLRSIDAVRIQVPPPLAAVTMRAVEVRPDDRFATAAELAEALAEELERLAPAYGAETAARWLREHLADEEGDSR